MEQAAPQAAGRTQTAATVMEALGDVRHHWGDAYEIWRNSEGFHALRRDGVGSQLDAPGADQLAELIRADYAARPVPRDFDKGDRG